MAAGTGLDTIAIALAAALPADRLVTDPDVLTSYAHDEAEWAPWQLPAALVRPRSAEEVQTVVRLCIEHRAPVVPRGAGTGLSGGANATTGSVVLSLERMDAVLQVDELERYAVVQPGVVNDDLRAHVARFGLWYPPDPASSPWSTIGGNVATNAGGVCCVKYGVTRDYVLALQVVTGTGELVRLGRRTAKGVAGFDLTGLMVGSEGTLGIVTEVTVRLRPLRAPERTIAGYFDSVVDAGRAVTAVAAGRGRRPVRRPPAGLSGAGAARPGAHRGRLRAQGRGAGDAGSDRGDRCPVRHPHRQHRARRRREPAPAADHPARRRGGPASGSAGVRGDHRRG